MDEILQALIMHLGVFTAKGDTSIAVNLSQVRTIERTSAGCRLVFAPDHIVTLGGEGGDTILKAVGL
jgi:hypothetical protein